TSQRIGKLPLVVGMPVMVTHNFDVAAGVVNGSRGFVRSVRYETAANGRRHAVSCVVYIPDMTGPALPGLPEKHAAILAEKVSM
ncbi:hypothetical protein C8F01DRAFT_932803, partial [Mycena amicta]